MYLHISGLRRLLKMDFAFLLTGQRKKHIVYMKMPPPLPPPRGGGRGGGDFHPSLCPTRAWGFLDEIQGVGLVAEKKQNTIFLSELRPSIIEMAGQVSFM